ncbi:TonB-dependent receptor [Shewanella fidelis]|uniref:TonB-dependent receptor n=1 Tax=Shewanella fidelis TaxID=173509 RepID=A0AAW8NNS1_9GAMM|nr:TonB-dependent receptor [Shewanella fidelis]MDR8523578.1 TonB-dependent receptor [Shewanella fidelis]MDW4810125.1 TonB-dependent receptor [Shewanella fidelis]MDW4814270.1 TonB-dependent receptor [Shewanella fidelis]MDW4818361.1 TonB-dependent receptor [Shewanella fidelis]MDW4823987.1 TonB-dependent receptor [Shewanella fidelis]
MFNYKSYSPVALAVIAAVSAPNSFAQSTTPLNDDIEVMVVTSDFRGSALEKMPSSVTVIDQQQIEDQGAQHFEDILNTIANFNWSGGSSRPKYFQIRGVGEQEEYQGAPNSSVGFVVDDIDLSGLGMASSMYDLQQVEVLRGPQGTRYGANALAGLIYLKSNDPTDVFEHGAEVSFGDDNLKTFSGFSSGPVTDSGKLLYRVSLQQHQQDGYRDNLYLGRSDTNNRDEFTGRAKLRWYATDDLEIDLTVLHANYDNGYDVWTLDNNGFDTLTDAPGEDKQKTTGSSLKFTYTGADSFQLTSLTSFAQSDTRHNYDGDWANPDYWGSRDCDGAPCEYEYNWDKQGERKTITQEFRLSSTEAGRIFADSTDWLVGIYGMDLQEDNHTVDSYSQLTAEYRAKNYALFGQLDSDLGANYALSVGLRVERRDSDYSDSAGDAFEPSETMWGGHIALSKALSDEHESYIRVARGYKAGGFNMSLPVELADKKEYDTEILYNYEIGLKSTWIDGAANTNLAIFFMDRQDQQVAASQQSTVPGEEGNFILFTENAGSSHNYGAELDGNWYATDNLQLYGSVGWLETAYGDYQYEDKYGGIVDLSGRELAHSPNFTFSLGATYRSDNGWFANVNASGKSDFYYSDSNESKSDAYHIFNAKIGYEADIWSAYLWGRNLFDEQYGVRGFYFGNEPDLDWADKQYIRYGDPRQIGVTFNVKFL